MDQDTQYNLISELYRDPRYAGRHVVVVGEKVYAAKTGEEKTRILARVMKAHPKARPLITYIPEEEALILAV